MVSNEEIKRRLELRRRGINPDEELNKADEVICSKCHAVNLENAKFCIGCGSNLLESSVNTSEADEIDTNSLICQKCGFKNNPVSKFCIGCGANLKEAPNENANSFDMEMSNEKEVLLTIKDGNDKEAALDTEIDSESNGGMEDIPEQAAEVNILDEIKKAKELLDMGAVSEEEYQKIKSKYLDKLG